MKYEDIIGKNCTVVNTEILERTNKLLTIKTIVFDNYKREHKEIIESINLQNGESNILEENKIYYFDDDFVTEKELFERICINTDVEYLEEHCQDLFRNVKYSLNIVSDKISSVDMYTEEPEIYKEYVCKINDAYFKIETTMFKGLKEIVNRIVEVTLVRKEIIDFEEND